MRDPGWKQFERRVARLLGTERIPHTGARAGADAETPLFVFQFKKTGRLPGYLRAWLDGVRGTAAARRPEKIGVVVLQAPRTQDLDAFVVVSLRDWLDLHGPARPVEEDVPIHSEDDCAPASTAGQR
jgi:hypothetical protein